MIEGKVEVAKAISKLQFDMICFTGSTFTGRLVGIEAAKNLVPCILELGGKCPTIVDQTANLEVSTKRILMAKFLNCGQTCIAVDHIFVHESIAPKFKEVLLKNIQAMYGEDNLLESKSYGKIVNDLHVNRISKMLNDKHGGTVLYGGKIDKDSQFIQPTVIEQPSMDSLIMKE